MYHTERQFWDLEYRCISCMSGYSGHRRDYKCRKMDGSFFWGINLEDIASPKCFEIEKRLEEELDIPVFHDDQHGTAIVVTAALMNAVKLTSKRIDEIKVVLNGPGAAGTAIIKMLLFAGVKNIVACDEFGILYKKRALWT